MNLETVQPGTDTPGLAPTPSWNMDNSNQWYANECFSKYWHHYNSGRQWYMNHLYYLNAVKNSSYYPPQMGPSHYPPQMGPSHYPPQMGPSHYPPQMGPSHPQPWNQIPQARGGWKQKKHRRHGKNFNQRQPYKSAASSKETESLYSQAGEEEEEEEEEEFAVEMTDEMREFLAKSSEFKRQKEMGKTEEDNSDKDSPCVNIEDLADHHREASHLPPSERPGARRTAQMKQLYGRKAGHIHGMETAVQMEFDRIVDVQQPKLWPNMPLKCVFH